MFALHTPSKPKLKIMNTMVMMLGVSLLNPSDSFIEYAKPFQTDPQRSEKTQAMLLTPLH